MSTLEQNRLTNLVHTCLIEGITFTFVAGVRGKPKGEAEYLGGVRKVEPKFSFTATSLRKESAPISDPSAFLRFEDPNSRPEDQNLQSCVFHRLFRSWALAPIKSSYDSHAESKPQRWEPNETQVAGQRPSHLAAKTSEAGRKPERSTSPERTFAGKMVMRSQKCAQETWVVPVVFEGR